MSSRSEKKPSGVESHFGAGPPGARRSLCVLGAVLLGVLLAALVLVWAPEANAQTMTGTIALDKAGIKRNSYRTNKARLWWVSFEDCLAGDAFSFPLTLSDFANTLEVWAGNEDCVGRRGNTDRGQCRLLQTLTPDDRSIRVVVPVRNIVGQKPNTLDVPKEGFPVDVCSQSTDPAGTKFTFYFMQTSGGLAVANTTWDGAPDGTGYDMVGPAAPKSISTGIGESQLTIEVGNITEDADRDRFAAYCVDLTAEAEADPSFMPAAGANLTCATPSLTPGSRPDAASFCGEATETSGSIQTDSDLINDHLYAVGVSAEDILGNAGPLSAIECATPKELTDFFELYKQANGHGGGGFCSLPPGGSRSARGATLLLGLLLASLRARRTRSRA